MSDGIDNKLEQIFSAVFELPETTDFREVRQGDLPQWDSLGHVLLMSAIENELGVRFDLAATIGLTSFESIRLYLVDGR